MKARKHEPEGSASAAGADIEPCLPEVLPGFELLDRDLELEGEGLARFVGIDASGRLVLVLEAGGEGEEPILTALDALAWARRSLPGIARHLRCERMRTDLAPRAVLIADSFSRRLTERLVPLAGRGIDLYELRTLKSRTGSTRWLVPTPSSEAQPEDREPASVDAFLDALPSELRECARLVVAKMRRLDDELDCHATRSSVAWRFRGGTLTRLELADRSLFLAVAPRFEPRALASSAEVERGIEEVLTRYVDELQGGRGSGGLPSVVLPMPAPVLTREEVAAFRA